MKTISCNQLQLKLALLVVVGIQEGEDVSLLTWRHCGTSNKSVKL